MKKLLIPLLVLLCFTAGAQVVTPITPQFTRKVPNDSILTAKVPNIALSFKLPDTSWVKKYTSTFFVHGLFIGTGTFSDPFGIANGYITPAMLHSISGVPGPGTVYYGDGHWGTVAGGVAHVSQGLHLSGDTVKLGGSITKDTVVTVTANHQFRIGDTPSGNGLYVSRASDSSMNVALGGGSQSSPIYGFFAVGGNGNIDIEAGNGSVDKSIQIDPTPSTGGMSIHDSDHLGLANAADYSTQIKLHPYALVQTNMLNARADSIISAVGGGIRHANQGLYISGDTVKLGGNITEYTPITIAPNTEIDIGDPVLSGNGLQIARFSDSTLTSTLIGGNKTGNIYGYLIAEGNGNTQIKAVNNSTYRGIQIDPTPSTGYIKVTDTEHKGLVGNELFPKYSGAQYAQYHGIDSIAKAKADSVKGTISSGVSTFNTRTGTVSLLSSDVTTALGFTPYNATNPSSYISRTGISATSPIFYNSSTGVISSQAASGSQAGYLTSTDWGTFNGKQAALTFDTTPISGSTNPVTSGGIYTYVTTSIGADGIVTGLVTTTVTTTATTTSGTYRLNNLLVVKSSSTNTTIPAQDATLNRYVLIVADASGVLSVVTGTLAADAVEPDIPTNKALIASIYIPATGGTVTTGGGGSGKGTVTKVTSSTTDILIANQTTTPILTLNKVNGFAISFYDPTSSIQTQLNSKLSTTTASSTYVPLTRTVNGKVLSSNITLGLASSDFANQGTTTTVLHGNAAGNPSFGQIVNADITNATIDLTTKVTGLLPVANGGTGVATLTGIAKGNGTSAFTAAVAGTDYQAPITLTTTGTSGAATFSGNTLNIPQYAGTTYTAGTGLTLTTGAFSVNTSQNIATLSNLTSNGLIKTSGGTGALSIATAGTDYQSPITLTTTGTSGAATFSGGTLNIPNYASSGTSAATASTIMARDANANTQINNLIENYTTTATAAGTTTLTAASAYQQYFTGTTTQTIVLPVASTLVVGMQYQIINQSTGIVTVQSSGTNTVQAMDGNSSAVFTCILTSGTSAASWSVAFYGPASTSNSGFVTTGTQSIAGAKTFTTGLNLTLAQNGKTQMNVSNSSSGAAAEARISVTNNSSGNTVLGVTSSGYTPFGALVANSSYVYSDASAGLVLMSNGASVIFASGGNAEKMRLNGAGRLLVGTSTDNGTDLIQANGTIISGIDGTTQGAVKITGTSGTVSLKTQLATTTYNYNLPVTAGTAGQVQASGGGGSSPMTWVSAPIIQGTADLTAQTAAGNITTFTVGAATATFSISAYVNVTAIATDVIQGQITYTDENSTSQTVNLTNISAIGNSAYSPIIIRAKTGTVITVKTNLSTSGGTITFDAGARITQL